MIYTDRVYGRIKIKEPVILELIASPSLQRLKDVEQGGYSPLYFQFFNLNDAKEVTRFEHSLGVFLLLAKYGAALEEQIAGLIHDVSHTVFSHTSDYIFDSGSPTNHNYQDKIHDEFVRQSEIPAILSKYQIDTDYILDESHFPLKEKPLPDLCADRIDYSLRNAIGYRVATRQQIDYFLKNLGAINNQWVFKNFRSAKKYAQLFLKLNIVHYAGFPTAVMFQAGADVLKHALKKGYLTKQDLFTTENQVLAEIKKHLKTDDELKVFYKRMTGKIKARNNPLAYEVRTVLKSRAVDPLFLTNGKINRLSEIDKSWLKTVKKEMKPKVYFLQFD